MKEEANLQIISLNSITNSIKNNINIKKIIIVTVLIALIAMIVPGTSLMMDSVYAQEMAKERSFPNAKKAKDEKPTTLGASACLIDAKSGYMIYGVDEHEQNYPASTTKILTALLTAERLDPTQEITVDEEASKQGGSQLFLSPGEIMSAENLLYGMMLPSANDAAIALAKAMAPTTAEFATIMNERAKEAGAQNSNFANPNGLPDENHYTTAYDLAHITKDALKHESIRKVISTYQYTLPKTNVEGARLIHNRNRLLYNINRKVEAYGETKSIKYEGVTGVKTGYTDAAKFCLVSSAERDGTELIAVTMKTEDMNGYQDAISMLDYGFNNYKTVELKAPGEKIENLAVKGGSDKYATAVVEEGLYATIPKDAAENDLTIKEVYNEIEAPYKKGIDGGSIEVYYEGEKVGEAEVLVTAAMEEGSAFDDIKTGSGILGVLFKIIIVIAILAVLLFIVRTININRRRRARRRRRRRESR